MMSPIRISTKDNVALTISDRSAEYRALVDAERRAEIEALAITNKIREQLHFGKDGRISGRHTPADVGLEAGAWAKVLLLRKARYKWVAQRKA